MCICIFNLKSFITVQIDVPKEQQSDYLLTGGGLPGIYQMDQMHFHWASEHTIDSKRYTKYCKLN